MMQYDLQELERRAYRSTFQDGLWDIYLGLILIGFGSMPILRNAISEATSIISYSIILVLAMTMLIVGKRNITMLRLGYVRFNKERQRKLSNVRMLLGGALIAGVIFFSLILSNSVGLAGMTVILAVIILIVFSGLAYFLDYYRLMIYAILCAVSLPIGVALENRAILNDAPTVLIFTGGIALLVGSVLLHRFLRDYHLPPENSING